MNKKEKIIKTSMKLFVKQGFEHTPTSQISEEAKVATGTLFHHFKTKEELINQTYIYVKKSMAEFIFKDFNDKLKTEEKIKVIWLGMIKWSFKNQLNAQFLEKFYGSSYIDKITVDEANSDFEKGYEVFAQAKKEKLIKEISKELFANLTFSMLYSFLKEFSKLKKLNNKLLEKSFNIYWDSLKI